MQPTKPLFMLDSNIVSALVEPEGTRRRELCEQRLKQLDGELAISVVVDAEARAGFRKSMSLRKEARFLELKRRMRVEYIDRDLEIAEIYAIERAALLRAGLPLSELDTFIVAHAIALGATLVSNDRSMSRVERLKLENWLLPEPTRPHRHPDVAEPIAGYAAGHRFWPAQDRWSPGVWMTRSGPASYVSSQVQ